MPKTPFKQPVAADTNYVDVDYIQPSGPSGLGAWAGAVQKIYGPDGQPSFAETVSLIMRQGIYAEDDSWFIPPSAIIKIRNRKEKS
jgi:hypothetical protein